MKRTLVLALVLFGLFGATANAAIQASKSKLMVLCNDDAETDGPWDGKWSNGTCSNYNVIDGTTLGADADERTIQIDVNGFSQVNIGVKVVDADASSTSLTLTCTASIDGGTTYYSEVSKTISSGAATLYSYTETWTLSAGTNLFLTQFGVWGYSDFKCVSSVAGTPGDADTLSLQTNKMVGY